MEAEKREVSETKTEPVWQKHLRQATGKVDDMYSGIITTVFKYAWEARGAADKTAILNTYVENGIPFGSGLLGEASERIISNDIGGAL